MSGWEITGIVLLSLIGAGSIAFAVKYFLDKKRVKDQGNQSVYSEEIRWSTRHWEKWWRMKGQEKNDWGLPNKKNFTPPAVSKWVYMCVFFLVLKNFSALEF